MIEWESPDQFIGTGIGMLIAGLAAGAGTITAAKIGSNAAKNAGTLEASAAEKQLAYLKAKDAQDQANWENTQAENRRQFDQTQQLNYGQWATREGNLAPYRAIGSGATATLANLMGVPFNPGSFAPAPYRAGAPAGGAAPASTADPKIAAFIADWQQTHPDDIRIAPLAAAIAKQFPTVSRYMYGDTPSGNELNVGGEKYKVLGGENSSAPYWYAPGTNDSAPGSGMPGGVARAVGGTPTPGYASSPVSFSALMAPAAPTLAMAPPRQALTYRDLMAAQGFA
jgi:hypothetical protein